MDINAANLANREIALNKTNVGADILTKTLEKAEETKQVTKSAKAQPALNNKPQGNSLIDTYA
jgi:hypothetical protein